MMHSQRIGALAAEDVTDVAVEAAPGGKTEPVTYHLRSDRVA